MARKHTPSSYKSWSEMKYRCNTESSKDYINYGGRGITYCDQWESFDGFYADMGDKPEGMSLGRIDNDGDYCPENCRWETPHQQMNNQRLPSRYVSGKEYAKPA